MAGTVQVKQQRSANGSDRAQRETLRTLGLRGIGSTATRPDNPATRGMIDRVAHLVTVEEAGDGS
jgi:large subunit ribosomal protein L30